MLDTALFPRRWPSWLPASMIGAGLAACAIGFIMHRMWLVLPAGRFGESILLLALSGALAWPMRKGLSIRWAEAIALVWAAALVWQVGVLPTLATVFLAIAAIALGSVIAGNRRPVLALLCGLILIVTVLGWMLALPIHRRWPYLLAGLALIAWRRHEAATLTRHAWQGWRAAIDDSPTAAAWSIALLGLATAACWPPTLQADDLAYHLGLPWQLLLHGRYDLDPTHQVWALAPWASDVVHAIPQVIAGAEARGAVNLLWLVATAAGLWRIGTALELRPLWRWGGIALFATLPMTVGLLGGMQTETAAAAILVNLATLILDRRAGQSWRDRFSGALLFAFLFALKPLHGLIAIPLLTWATLRARSANDIASKAIAVDSAHPPTMRMGAWLALASIGLAVALPSYVLAWWRTGNPLLPLFNQVFRSPYFPAVALDDARWHAGGGLLLPWRVTFDTASYLEGWNGGNGFVLVVLAGAWLVGLLLPATRALAVCATLATLLPLLTIEYARYMHPGIVLLLPVLALALQQGLSRRSGLLVLGTFCVLQLMFQANANWLLHVGAPKRSLAALGRDEALFARYAPERLVAAAQRSQQDTLPITLVASRPAHAEFAGHGRTIAWYAPAWQAAAGRADRDPSGTAWVRFLTRQQVGEVLVATGDASIEGSASPALHAALEQLGAGPQKVTGELERWTIPPRKAP